MQARNEWPLKRMSKENRLGNQYSFSELLLEAQERKVGPLFIKTILEGNYPKLTKYVIEYQLIPQKTIVQIISQEFNSNFSRAVELSESCVATKKSKLFTLELFNLLVEVALSDKSLTSDYYKFCRMRLLNSINMDYFSRLSEEQVRKMHVYLFSRKNKQGNLDDNSGIAEFLYNAAEIPVDILEQYIYDAGALLCILQRRKLDFLNDAQIDKIVSSDWFYKNSFLVKKFLEVSQNLNASSLIKIIDYWRANPKDGTWPFSSMIEQAPNNVLEYMINAFSRPIYIITIANSCSELRTNLKVKALLFQKLTGLEAGANKEELLLVLAREISNFRSYGAFLKRRQVNFLKLEGRTNNAIIHRTLVSSFVNEYLSKSPAVGKRLAHTI